MWLYLPSTSNRGRSCGNPSRNYYKLKKGNPDIQIRRIINPGIMDHYCQFTGGGDIHLEKLGELLVIYSGSELSDVTLSPTEDTEIISCLTIEAKKSDFTDERLLDHISL